ncbi:protein eyes shut [Schistocerca gregaria]|uniref:protein eyes shut n=1 Tax=Schistocerca gregaria TaxID=7010 RepID=UPI00211E86E8|nr:protein eyes shut [Schistocerca gregaria]
MKLLGEVFIVALYAIGLFSSITKAGFACLSNPCIHGICIDDLNSSYTCYCIDGYTGIQCQTNWDECWSNPCMNGGTCIDGVASYNCTCPDGYMGEQCEENFDECESNPCLNNGTCVDEVNGYVCQCLPGYSGVMCEIDEEVCNNTAETNCYNGGLCIEGPGISFSCICSPGWSGTFCELPVDECASTPCQNGAVCVDLKADYACACLFGFTGKNCEVKLVRCEDNPCENDALCLIESGGAVCYCVPDFHGNKCQYQYDECQLGPRCLNGGTCLDGIDNFTCSCPPNLTGRICECLIISPGHLNCSFILPSTSEFPTQTATVASTEYLTSAFSSGRTVPKSTTLTDGKVSRTTAPTFTETVLPSSSTFSFMAGTSSTHPSSEPISSYFTSSSETVVPDTELSTTTAKQMFTDVTVYQEKSSKIIPQTESSTLTSTEMLGTNITTEKLKPVSVQTLTVPSYTEMVSEIATLPSVEEKSTLIPPDYYTTGPFTTEKVTLPPPSGETDETKSISLTSVGVETFSDDIFTVLQTVKTTVPTSDISALDTTEFEYTTATQVIPSAETEVYTSTAKIPDCSVTPCLHGGTCTYFEGWSQCKCKSEWTGPLCEVYTGNDTVAFREHSFVTHHLIEKTGAKIEVQARTLVLSGILLHAQLTSNVYMAVYIEDGLLNFQFSCGVQTMLFTEVRSLVNNGYDLKVQAMLELLPYSIVPQHCNAYLRINDSLAMSGEQIAATSQIGKTVNVLYLGGFPAEYSDLSEVQMKTGFIGCMHGLMVDNMPRHILHDSLSASGISECASLACLSNPCYDGGTCVEHNDEWNCLCPSGYVGKACEKSVCEVNPCQFGATCVIFPGSGFLCLCPLGKHGIFCEHDLDIGQPSFSPSVAGFSSYTAYPLPGTIHHNMELRFRFKPSSMEQIALMIFVGQDGSHDAQSDHLSVSFIKGYVVLTWNLGSGPRRIFTPRPVTQRAKRPHFVSLGRSGKHAWLRVDNLKNVTGTSPGHMTQLNTHSPLYIGGHESANFSLLPHDLPLHSGFSGCLFDVELRTGRISVPLQKTRTATGRSVGQCGTTECHEHACQNGGACLHHGASFVCLCADGWFGPVCAQQHNPCDSSQHKCSSGATCVPLINGYECDCPFGKVGTYCERNETPSDVHFSGRRSFISLPIKYLHENEICIELEIRPLADRGLLLFIGQPDTNSFMSLSLQGGVLELRILPGQSRKRSETIVIRSGRVLAPREWHQVLAWRYGRKLYLRVDGSLSTGTMHAGEKLPALGKVLYLGGTGDLSNLPNAAMATLPEPFTGCIRRVYLNWEKIPLDEKNMIAARNVADCDGTPCGGDVCEHGGTCWLDPYSQPRCSCKKFYTGAFCESQLTCTEDSCQNNGRCMNRTSAIAECSCPLGWGGATCEEAVMTISPHFGGNGYLVVEGSGKSAKQNELSVQTKMEIGYLYINFSTIESKGMILWSSMGQEYLGIGIEEGLLKFAWGHPTTNRTLLLVSGGVAADGTWHTLEIDLSPRNITVWFDSQLIHSETEEGEGSKKFLITDGIFYLGGFPGEESVTELSNGLFSSHFIGCIKELAWNKNTSVTDFSDYQGENVGSCASIQT